MSPIGIAELEAITREIDARDPSASPRDIREWCAARDVDVEDVLFYARAMTRSCLETIAAVEGSTGKEAEACQVEAAIAAAIVTALQVGVDAERRRRDDTELPR